MCAHTQDDFFSLKHLVMLDLSRNQLSQLPKNFGQLVNLQKLILEGNRLTSLPLSFYHLNKLKWLDLKQNELDPELMEAVGHCLSEKECKDCAARVCATAVDHADNTRANFVYKVGSLSCGDSHLSAYIYMYQTGQ